jgi:hypothetical protein
MEILIPPPRVAKRSSSWLWAAALCVPSLIAWGMVGLEWSGVSQAMGDALSEVPRLVLAVITLGCPLAAGLMGSIAVVRDARAGQGVDRRQVAVAVAGFLIAAVTASAALARIG